MGPRRALTRTLAAVALLLLTACLINGVYPFMWISMPMTGRVLDNATGTPVPCAVVSATWLLTSIEGASLRYLKVAETQTDAEGHFRIAPWGPKFAFGLGRLKGSEPEIRVLAEGYTPVLGSLLTAQDAPALLRYSQLKQPIRLKPPTSDAELASAFTRALNGLRAIFNAGCEWTELPNTLRAMNRTRVALESRGTPTTMLSIDNLGERDCPNEPIFREDQQ